MLSAIIIRLLFSGMSWYSYIAIMVAIYQFILLFNSIGHVIPVRYLLGSFMCLQFFIGPAFAYNGLDAYQYFVYLMKVPEAQYFGYALPAVILFILGLHVNAGMLNGEVVDQERVKIFVKRNPKLPYFFIIMGFVTSFVSGFFGSELSFVFYLLGSFKFIGLFLMILGSDQLKPLPISIVIGSIISSSLGSGMFHDLLTWIVFIAAVFGIRYKFDFKTKLIGAFAFVVLAATIQVMKGAYRTAIGGNSGQAGVKTFTKLADEKNEQGGLLNFTSLAESNVRINQGFIITNIMVTVPDRVPFQNGKQMWQLFEAGVLPRILAPNKLRAGDRAIFTKYSGIPLTAGTSMGLSSLGDAYVNFAVWGGCVFMFLLGLMYNGILQIFYKNSKSYPILILFTALVFYYPIRPDCELQTILGHLFKSCFLIGVIIVFWKHQFRVPLFYKRPVAVS